LETFFGLLVVAFCLYLIFGRREHLTSSDKAALRKVDKMRKAIKEAEVLMGVSKPPEADRAVNLTITSKKPEAKPPDS
jgi:Na+/H+-translocating membrane pyrophosphatase